MNEWSPRAEVAPTVPPAGPMSDAGDRTDPLADSGPDQRLDRRAIRIWRFGELVGWGGVLIVALPGLWALDRFTAVSRWLVALAALGLVVLAAVSVVVVPSLRWRSWRYRVGEVEVDLERGYWTVVRTRIPMARIQHVDTTRSPLQRRYGLASVVLYTAAGASEIPALADGVAEAVRSRIASLANSRDDV